MHVKRVELSNFKSFGGATDVPLLPGFTVISGPNGSGKSNILDSLLFCLGLASSRGMRAERLPDLVNQTQAKRRSTVETIVTATFDITDVADKLLSNEEEEDEANSPDESSEDAFEGDTLEAEVVASETEKGSSPDVNGFESNGFKHIDSGSRDLEDRHFETDGTSEIHLNSTAQNGNGFSSSPSNEPTIELSGTRQLSVQ
ncbi:MAG: AAA family ATPase, partial [Cyanobacteria bacterium J06560_2]